MAVRISKKFRDLFQIKALAHLATLMPDGSPQVTPVWVDYDGKHVLVNSAQGRVKDRNMEKRRKVALSIVDPENPFRYLSIRGEVVEIIEEEQGARDHINKLSQRYRGKPYPTLQGEQRRIYKIAVKGVFSSD